MFPRISSAEEWMKQTAANGLTNNEQILHIHAHRLNLFSEMGYKTHANAHETQ